MRILKVALATAAGMSMMTVSTGAQAAACQPGASGCVLPLPGAAPPPPVQTSAPVQATPVVEEFAEPGFNFVPFLIGAVVLAAIAAFFLLDEDEEEDVSP